MFVCMMSGAHDLEMHTFIDSGSMLEVGEESSSGVDEMSRYYLAAAKCNKYSRQCITMWICKVDGFSLRS